MEAIRSILQDRAGKRRTITYAKLASMIGRGARGPWFELDELCVEEAREGRPDLTLCIVSQETNLPSKYLGQPLSLDDAKRIERYFEDLETLFRFWVER